MINEWISTYADAVQVLFPTQLVMYTKGSLLLVTFKILEGTAYLYDTVKAEDWVKYSYASICKAGDSFQIIKQEGNIF